MKLRLAKPQDLPPGIEPDSGISVLIATATASESAELEETLVSRVSVIRAGLAQLTGAEVIVLDLGALPSAALQSARNQAALQEFAAWGGQQPFELLLVMGGPSGLPRSFATMTEALLYARSPVARLERKERAVQARVTRLETERDALRAQLATLAAPAEEIRRLRRETTELKRKAARIQAWVDTEGRARPAPFQNSALDARRRATTELLRSLFAEGA